MRSLTILAAAVLATTAAGCTHHPSNTAPVPRDAPSYLVVQNTIPEPMDMFVSDGVQRLRLGQVAAMGRARFRIPPSMVFPAITLTFIAVPISGAGAAISERLAVSPGDEIHLQLQP